MKSANANERPKNNDQHTKFDRILRLMEGKIFRISFNVLLYYFFRFAKLLPIKFICGTHVLMMFLWTNERRDICAEEIMQMNGHVVFVRRGRIISFSN